MGLIGANGAGKTTFINMVTGYLKPTAGSIRFEGRDITGMPPREITRLGMCRSFQIPQVFDSLTVFENMLVGLAIVSSGAPRLRGQPARGGQAGGRRRGDAGALPPGRVPGEPASVLPEGIRKLLDIAMAMVVQPRILLLDEPTSGVSAEEKFGLMDMVMGAIRADKVTVLFVEHDMEIVPRFTQRILAFYDGNVIADADRPRCWPTPR